MCMNNLMQYIILTVFAKITLYMYIIGEQHVYSIKWVFTIIWSKVFIVVCSHSRPECHQAAVYRYTKQEVCQWTTSWACTVSWIRDGHHKWTRLRWSGPSGPVEAPEATGWSFEQSSSGFLSPSVASPFPGTVQLYIGILYMCITKDSLAQPPHVLYT